MFQIKCPHCGLRNVSEFRFGGEVLKRPQNTGEHSAWKDYLYLRHNAMGVQTEWWYHRMGCQRWFKLKRSTVNNANINAKGPS